MNARPITSEHCQRILDYVTIFRHLAVEFTFLYSLHPGPSFRDVVDDFSFFDCSSSFWFCSLNLIRHVFWLGRRDFFFFRPRFTSSMLTPLFIPSSSVSLSYFILAVPMHEGLGKHSCMSSPFPICHTE